MTRRQLFMQTMLLCLPATISAQVLINEIMQSNIHCIMDDLNDFPDSWVEIYNSGTSSVSLNGYRISLRNDFQSACVISGYSSALSAKKHAIIYCDKVGDKRHADFRLESGNNGAIYLFNPSGQLVDKLEKIPKMPAPDVAYGRTRDGAGEWSYLVNATPGQSNNNATFSTSVLEEPIFSIPGGIYEGGQQLFISTPYQNNSIYKIRYTLDGSEPTASSKVVNPATPLYINSTTCVKARIFADGVVSRPSRAHTYVIHGRKVTLPVICINTNPEYLYDSKIGIYTDGSYSTNRKNYEYDWRRPATIEYFPSADDEAAINQLGEIRICGGASRGCELKSFAIYANKRFGNKNYDYPLWADKPDIKIKSFMLRNSGNDFCYSHFRDAAIQIIFAKNADLDWQAYQPAIVYLNGKYVGIQNLRERSNDDNIYSNYDGLEDIDMLENWWDLKSGSFDNYRDFERMFYNMNTTYEEFGRVMDIGEFINLIILNTYHANCDFPGNNIVMWRPTATDGKWRWIVKDTDFGLGLYGLSHEYDYLGFILRTGNFEENWANTEHATMLVRNLMAKQEFKDQFIDRFAVYMGDFLNQDYGGHIIDSLKSNLQFEYPYHKNLYQSMWWMNWDNEVSYMKEWMGKRTSFMYGNLTRFFNIGEAVPVSVNADGAEQQIVNFNGHTLSGGRFDGRFFRGRTISLTANAAEEGKTIGGWQVDETTSKGTSRRIFDGDKLSYTLSSDIMGLSIKGLVAEANAMGNSINGSISVNVVNKGSIVINGLSGISAIELYDARGILMNSFCANDFEYMIHDVAKGYYILNITDETGKHCFKVVV